MAPRRSPYGFDLLESCSSCQWRTDHFFCSVKQEALKAFDHHAFANVYPHGALLFAEGEPPRGVFMLCRGRVKLSIASGDGKTLITRIVRAGEALGLSSVLGDHAYRATAETLEPSQVKFIRADDFVRWMDEFAEGWRRACRQLSEEVVFTDDHVRSLGLSHSAKEKLAHLILTWCNEDGHESPAGTRVQLLMTHEEISQRIGTSRETVTRLLKYFRDKKIVAIKGSSLTVTNKAALESLISM
jgi:CRP/FNR family transcriptional regulator